VASKTLLKDCGEKDSILLHLSTPPYNLPIRFKAPRARAEGGNKNKGDGDRSQEDHDEAVLRHSSQQ